MARRHTDLSSKAASVAVGAQDHGAMSPDILSQIEQLKERLQATESELMNERQQKTQVGYCVSVKNISNFSEIIWQIVHRTIGILLNNL